MISLFSGVAAQVFLRDAHNKLREENTGIKGQVYVRVLLCRGESSPTLIILIILYSLNHRYVSLPLL